MTKIEENIEELEADELEKEFLEIEKGYDTGFDAVITNIRKTTNTEYYGKTVYDERPGIEITYKINTTGEEYTEFYAKPSMRGYAKSKLKKFYDTYKSFPKKGLPIVAEIDENGFFQIRLEL